MTMNLFNVSGLREPAAAEPADTNMPPAATTTAEDKPPVNTSNTNNIPGATTATETSDPATTAAGEQTATAAAAAPASEQGPPAGTQAPAEGGNQGQPQEGGQQPASTGQPANGAVPAAGQPDYTGLLEQLGLDKNTSLEDLKARLNPPAQLTPEEQQRQNNIRRSKVQEYAVANMDGYSPADFAMYDQVQQLPDRDVVYAEFKKQFIARYKDSPLLAGQNIDTVAEDVFNQQYHIIDPSEITSENELMATIWQATLKATADNIRSGYAGKVMAAEQRYDQQQLAQKKETEFLSLIKTAIQKNVPASLSHQAVLNEKENRIHAVNYELQGKVDVAELEKYLYNVQNFSIFNNKGPLDAESALNEQIANFIIIKHHKPMMETAIKGSYDAGTAAGAVGAKVPFNANPTAAAQIVNRDQMTTADDQKVALVIGGSPVGNH